MLGVIVVGKLVVAFASCCVSCRSPGRSALTLGGSSRQIGEFSFILARSASRSGCSSARRRRSSSRAALVSITVNQPLGAWLSACDRAARSARSIAPALEPPVAIEIEFGGLTGHVVLVGYGRVGTTVTEALDRAGVIHIVVEEQPRVVAGLRLRGEHGDLRATRRARRCCERAGVAARALIVVTAPEPIRARRIVEVARELNPASPSRCERTARPSRRTSRTCCTRRASLGRAVYAEREVALSLAHFALLAVGRTRRRGGHADRLDAWPRDDADGDVRRDADAGARGRARP